MERELGHACPAPRLIHTKGPLKRKAIDKGSVLAHNDAFYFLSQKVPPACCLHYVWTVAKK